MSNVSDLGDLGYRIACLGASTSTASFVNIAAGTDTGTVVATGRIVDLSYSFGYSNTGGKPLDATVNPLSRKRTQYRSIGIALPLELVYHSSGKSIHVQVAHNTRSSTAGAGSTWAAAKTDNFRFKMGTDTDATIFHGVVSGVPTMFLKKFYKATVTVRRRKATSTSAKDTTTDTSVLINSPVYLFAGADSFPEQTNQSR
jgi:hypothetical protein